MLSTPRGSLTPDDWLELEGVHPALVGVVALAAFRWPEVSGQLFRVTSGRRTFEEQKLLHEAGITPALGTSKHIRGTAVDLAVLTKDRRAVVWDLKRYRLLDVVMQRAALDVLPKAWLLEWGGNWPSRDGPHWELVVPH